jgi:glycerol kinase
MSGEPLHRDLAEVASGLARRYILAIDQGTSSTKSIVFSLTGQEVARASSPLHTTYTPDGKAEQDPEAIYRSVIDAVDACVRELENKARIPRREIACAGIANQRETFVLWDEKGPLHDAVVWQCKRSVEICRELKEAGAEPEIRDRSGLILDPYFSGTKLTALLRSVPSVRASHDAGGACFGTVDTWLLHRLTGARVHATDYTNASRTLLFNIHTLDWDEELARIIGAPSLRLPAVYPSAHRFAESAFDGIFDSPVAITAMIGDSHAALFGERCYRPGEAKVTLGTGASILINAGAAAPPVSPSAMSTIGFGLPGRTDYALEGIVVSAGSVLTWLQRDLGMFDDPSRLAEIARSVADAGGVCVVPGHAGLGAPFWTMDARGSITGLTLATSKAQIVRAALECIPYQIRAILDAIAEETGIQCRSIRADGGISRNEFVMQWMADTLGLPVHTFAFPDVTALGAALLAGIGAGIYGGTGDIDCLALDDRVREPSGPAPGRFPALAGSGYAAWRRQVDRLTSAC